MPDGLPSRRAFLASVGGVGALALAGGARGAGSTANGARTDARVQSCTPGHTDGDPACTQIRHDANALVGFSATDTDLVATFSYPCGWTTTTTTAEDRVQANVARSNIGAVEASVDVQVRNYTEPVESGYLDGIRSDGDWVEVNYRYAGRVRTGIVSAPATAEFGTTAHAVVPDPASEGLIHVELISSMHGGAECSSPRPDYRVVRNVLASLSPNEPEAGVTIDDQTVSGQVQTQAVTVARVDLPAGGYVAIHDTPLGSDLSATVIGASNYLSTGAHQNVRIALDQRITGSQDVVATAHRDTDGDNAYEFGDPNDPNDGPYETLGGDPVSDRATVGVATDTPIPTSDETPTPTLEPLETETPTPTRTPTPTLEPLPTTERDESTQGEGSGFGVVGAVGAIGGLGVARWLGNRGED